MDDILGGETIPQVQKVNINQQPQVQPVQVQPNTQSFSF
jgi:hypothetical protein